MSVALKLLKVYPKRIDYESEMTQSYSELIARITQSNTNSPHTMEE